MAVIEIPPGISTRIVHRSPTAGPGFLAEFGGFLASGLASWGLRHLNFLTDGASGITSLAVDGRGGLVVVKGHFDANAISREARALKALWPHTPRVIGQPTPRVLLLEHIDGHHPDSSDADDRLDAAIEPVLRTADRSCLVFAAPLDPTVVSAKMRARLHVHSTAEHAGRGEELLARYSGTASSGRLRGNHGDIKTANLIVTGPGAVRFIDPQPYQTTGPWDLAFWTTDPYRPSLRTALPARVDAARRLASDVYGDGQEITDAWIALCAALQLALLVHHRHDPAGIGPAETVLAEVHNLLLS